MGDGREGMEGGNDVLLINEPHTQPGQPAQPQTLVPLVAICLNGSYTRCNGRVRQGVSVLGTRREICKLRRNKLVMLLELVTTDCSMSVSPSRL
eukprot:754827-Hanusia_phi.AAC.9